MSQDTTPTELPLDLRGHMKRTAETATYPFAGLGNVQGLMYVGLGLAGEAGEIANQVKKIARDDGGLATPERIAKIVDELGDVMWYWLRLCYELGLDPYTVLEGNQAKLTTRAANGTLNGDRRSTRGSLVRAEVADWEARMAEASGKEDVYAVPLEAFRQLIFAEAHRIEGAEQFSFSANATKVRCRSLRCTQWSTTAVGPDADLHVVAMMHIMQEHTPWGRAGRD